MCRLPCLGYVRVNWRGGAEPVCRLPCLGDPPESLQGLAGVGGGITRITWVML